MRILGSLFTNKPTRLPGNDTRPAASSFHWLAAPTEEGSPEGGGVLYEGFVHAVAGGRAAFSNDGQPAQQGHRRFVLLGRLREGGLFRGDCAVFFFPAGQCRCKQRRGMMVVADGKTGNLHVHVYDVELMSPSRCGSSIASRTLGCRACHGFSSFPVLCTATGTRLSDQKADGPW